MAVEDAAVLAKLFSHLSDERQVQSFLYAFQELRQPRTRSVRAGEFGNIFYMTLEECAETARRDSGMREKAAAGGRNVLEGLAGDVSRLWDEVRTIFGYDCEDEADDWWVQWGLLRERALGRQGGDDEDEEDDEEEAHHPAPFLNFGAMSVQVSLIEDEED